MRSITKRLLDADSVMERYFKFKRRLDDVMLPYKELHRYLRQSARQLMITDGFFSIITDVINRRSQGPIISN